jgi:hypothetical protein
MALEKDRTPIGEVVFQNCEMQGISLQSAKADVRAGPIQGKVWLPAGSYHLDYVCLAIKDQDGKIWTYWTRTRKAGALQVRAGALTTYDGGGPFKLELDVADENPTWSFTLSLLNHAGDPLPGLDDPKGNRPTAPELVIKDSSGNIIKTLAFAYG